jgi:pilus assembly protein CpaE
MTIYLFRGNAEPRARSAVESQLLASIPNLIELTNFKQIFERSPRGMAREPAIVLVAAPPEDTGYFDRLIEVAAQYRNDVFLVLISDEISASDYKRLVRTGAADWASAKAGPQEVLDIIVRRQMQFRIPGAGASASQRTPPVTISFVPSAGGVGNTTLAVETAISLKTGNRTQQGRICIVDLDFQTSHVCDYLDSEPRLQIEEFSTAPERLDEHLFETFTTHHSAGIDVFAAPRSKFSPERLNVSALDALFNMITKRYDLIFIDHPLPWFSWTTQVIVASDGVVVTGINTIPCLRQIAETVRLVRSNVSTSTQIGIALNRCDRTFLGSVARRGHVAQVLRDERVFFVSVRAEAVESVNMGIPMALGGSAGKARKEMAPLAGFCAEIKSIRQGSAATAILPNL